MAEILSALVPLGLMLGLIGGAVAPGLIDRQRQIRSEEASARES